jgi:hypothetical protein
MRLILHSAFACGVACGLAACGVTNPSDLTMEPAFSGAVAPFGASTIKLFSTSKTGEFIVNVTAMSPDNGATLTAIYGASGVDANGNPACLPEGSAPAGLNKLVFDQTLPKGDYCFQLYDATGALPRTESFTVTIQHS